jgi:hypothetical protein
MKRRFTKLPIASIAVVIGSLLVGLSLAPVVAQSQLTNGQVTIRSDGAVYLIANGMRRWVATVVITDEELNAYPEAEPIYVGLAPFGSTSAGTGTTSTGTTAASKTGTTAASKTGTTAASKTGTTAASKTGTSSTSSSSSSATEEEVEPGQIVINPTSGADKKDPNDRSLAAVTTTADPSAKAEPTKGGKECPATHQVKGGFDKKYYDVDRPNYATVEAEACFVSGSYAREFGYTDAKKN